MAVLLTGAAGFIGMHTAVRLLEHGTHVVGVDNFDPYYDPALKELRASTLCEHPGFELRRHDIADRDATAELFREIRPQSVIHLAAQPGVRFGIDHPRAYDRANLAGMLTILEGCRECKVDHLLYASSSSVYGDSGPRPSATTNPVDHPISLYAATKKSDELMAYAYASLYGLKSVGLRFFTVYGPWGRPDMATWTFTKRILAGEPIDVYGEGKHTRDFTFIRDIVNGLWRIFNAPPEPSKGPPASVFNIGHGSPVPLLEYIRTLEEVLDTKANLTILPRQPGDVADTHAEVSQLQSHYDWKPEVSLEEGLKEWADWYLAHMST